MNDRENPLRFNIGFIIAEANGYSRQFSVDIGELSIEPDVHFNSCKGSVSFTRTSEGILVQGKLTVHLQAVCVRCLDLFKQRIKIHFDELFNFPSHVRQENDLILPANGYLDLTSLVREYILLEMPINPLCSPTCKGLCNICGENLNKTTCLHDEDEIDERLQILAQLKSVLQSKEQNTLEVL